MNPVRLQALLEEVARGQLAPERAAEMLRRLPFEKVEALARVDHHRELRVGSPEVVFGESKSASEIAALLNALDRGGNGALATRVSADKAEEVERLLSRGRYQATGRLYAIEPTERRVAGKGTIAVVSAGTSDLACAEEAAGTAEFLGHSVHRFNDVGVAGLHRILSVVEELRSCTVIIVIAGMEGALPTVVSGLVSAPVIGVPSSVGYGVGAGGVVAMLGMLASCSPGMTVVNIDNGFGAAIAAARINASSTPAQNE